MWYRNTLARRRAEVALAKQRLRPDRPELPSPAAKPPRIKKQDLYTLLAGGFAATMVLGPTRALKLATRGAAIASELLLPPSDPQAALDRTANIERTASPPGVSEHTANGSHHALAHEHSHQHGNNTHADDLIVPSPRSPGTRHPR